MKRSHIADLNSTAFIIAACFAHGATALLLCGLAVLELMRYAVLKRLDQ